MTRLQGHETLSEKNKQTKPFYLSYFEKLYESWEISAEKALTLWIQNPLFSNIMERAVEKSLEFKKYTREIIDKTLKYRIFTIDKDFAKFSDFEENLPKSQSKLEGKIEKAKKAKISKKVRPKRRRNKK